MKVKQLTRLLPAILAASLLGSPARAQWVVVDPGSIFQSTVSAVEAVKQTLQQIAQYKTQLDQYKRMLTDAVVPGVYLWDQISQTVVALKSAQQVVRNSRGVLKGELKDLLDPNYYRGSNCYNSQGAKGGCFERYKQLMAALSAGEIQAQDARDKQIDAQLDSLAQRATKEQTLQQNASSAKGQLEAIQYTNQLLDTQYAELRDTRALLVTQQQWAAEERRKQLVREAASQALSDQWHGGDEKFKRSSAGSW